ncbi:C39 family peptidase [Clostridium sp. Marseille-P3244]|uniref:C39 family peptidase n=1 Tax=Clostridium sp. Marseille-P3244 TaxID=1871020 RepID=UPI0009FA515C|nr:C39 family peptidase [Clostridium sp. Marseille-P3244]
MKGCVSSCLLLAALLYFAGGLFQVLGRETSSMVGIFGNMSAQRPVTRTEEPGDSIGEERKETIPDEAFLADFAVILQMPQLPTGCEITALTMILGYYGYVVDKTVMASDYLPVLPAEFYQGTDGKLYGPDMEDHFVGDPASSGYVCGPGAIVAAGNRYLAEQGSRMRVEDMTGASPETLYRLVARGIPVLVWVTIGMKERREVQGWYTEDGRYMEWSSNDHGAVLIGYSEDTVTVADPILGLRVYSRSMFERVFASRENQCVILRNM